MGIWNLIISLYMYQYLHYLIGFDAWNNIKLESINFKI